MSSQEMQQFYELHRKQYYDELDAEQSEQLQRLEAQDEQAKEQPIIRKVVGNDLSV